MQKTRAELFRKTILKFFKQKKGCKNFTSPQLIKYVQKETKFEWFYPDTLLRELRQLRQDGKVNYEVRDKASMIYWIK